MSGPGTPFPAAGHDHRDCVNRALLGAERHCARRGLRLTPVRRRVLELIWRSHRPSGAYELLEQLAAEARSMGFSNVASGPMVRSSYHADQQAKDVVG